MHAIFKHITNSKKIHAGVYGKKKGSKHTEVSEGAARAPLPWTYKTTQVKPRSGIIKAWPP